MLRAGGQKTMKKKDTAIVDGWVNKTSVSAMLSGVKLRLHGFMLSPTVVLFFHEWLKFRDMKLD